MKKTTSGFTIIELLIVIVVIAILAAIVTLAFSGIQTRARDNVRYADAKAIIKALELYKTNTGSYPNAAPTGSAICVGHTNGYDYSDATDGNWLRPLITTNVVSKLPVAPNNGCLSHYRYLKPGATDYNCPSRTTRYYVLEIVGVETSMHPSDASDPSNGDMWRPCSGATAGWGYLNDWAFAKDDI